jgi:cytoskeletal protein CcmA (bactofilin family)
MFKPTHSPKPHGGFDTAPSSPAPSETPTRKAAAKMASLLAADLTIDGDVASEGELHVEGVIRGDVKAPRLSIGESGQIEGNIHADVVEARGKVTGSITAKQVRLLSTSHVEGDITHEQLTMETGAHFQGRSLKFQRPAVAAAAPAPAAPAPAPKADVVSITAAGQAG